MSGRMKAEKMGKQPASVREAAQFFHFDEVTIRRWIRSGCPVIRRGCRGPNQGSLLDLQQVARWRGQAKTQEAQASDDTMQLIATALEETLRVELCDVRAGVSRDDAAALLLVAWQRLCKTFGKSFHGQGQPKAIRTLLSVL